MQTTLLPEYLASSKGREADGILRRCVHCGFCTATCPTYQLLGDELDGPRGRIYLIKQMLEGQSVHTHTRLHLDRCLLCLACETTCPSGVQYGRLLEYGREVVEQKTRRPPWQWFMRRTLRWVMPYPKRFALLLKLGCALRGVMPKALSQKLPRREQLRTMPSAVQARRMLVLEGCVQSAVTPNTNQALSVMLEQLGIQLLSVPGAGCCGGLSLHLNARDEALEFMRRNIDAWWPEVDDGVEAILVSASGCGVTVREYADLLQGDAEYAARAKRISDLCKDPAEVLAREDLSKMKLLSGGQRVAFHSPCTLQHGLQLSGAVESVLQRLGFNLVAVDDAHLCCGSAGTYSLLQPGISQQLLRNKLANLQNKAPELIATANIGCQLHLATAASVPVKHWLVMVAECMPTYSGSST